MSVLPLAAWAGSGRKALYGRGFSEHGLSANLSRMARISIKVGLKALPDSNAFLRALWAELRREFGRLAWAYMPHREGIRNVDSFGEVQLGGNYILSVFVLYKTRGSIEEIIFSDENSHMLRKSDVGQDIFSRINNSVQVALISFQNMSQFIMQSTLSIQSDREFWAYEGMVCALCPIGPGRARLRIRISAFDNIDAKNEYMVRAVGICDQLTTWTNIPVTLSEETDSDDVIDAAPIENADLQPNTAWAEADWIDGVPLIENRIAITREQFSWIDAYAGHVVDYSHPIARATRHFAEALRLRSVGQFPETSQTLLVSALEVISEEASDRKTCPQCGQLVHKISKRVHKMSDRYLGSFAADRIKTFYEHRSKFLHAGVLPAYYPAAFGSMPQLDASDPSGCVLPRSSSADINLVEFTGFIWRAECSSWWAASRLDQGR